MERCLSKDEITDLRAILTPLANLKPRNSNLSKKVTTSWGICAVCGKPNSKAEPLHAAHIIPREERGPDDTSNLIALCVRKYRSIRQNTASLREVGCHDLYDKHGFWASKQILRLLDHKAQIKQFGSAESLGVFRPAEAKPEDIKSLLQNKLFGLARKRIDARLKENPLINERVKLALQGIVVERKSRLRNRFHELALRSTEASRSVKVADESKLNEEGLLSWYYYEMGMISFLLRDYEEAAASLRNRRGLDPGDKKVLINEAQACIAAFENSRRNGGDVKDTAKDLAKVVSSIKEICEKKPEMQKESERIKKAVEELKPWLVDSRLHLSRMMAYLGDTTVANNLLTDAVNTRDSFDGKGGWEQSVRSVLLLAKGEMHKIQKTTNDYLLAQEYLARAGLLILRERYKEYEYLENVLDGLIAILHVQQAEVDVFERLKQYRRRLDEHVGEIRLIYRTEVVKLCQGKALTTGSRII